MTVKASAQGGAEQDVQGVLAVNYPPPVFGPGAHTAALGTRFDTTEQASRSYR